MDLWLAIIILLEIANTIFLLWAFKREHLFIAFEDEIIRLIKERLRK